MTERSIVTTARLSSVSAERSEKPGATVDLGKEPPIDPAGLSTPQGDRRAVSIRWLAGNVLAGMSGAALIGATMYICLQGDSTFAALPQAAAALPVRHGGVGERGPASISKGDRLGGTQALTAAKQSFKAPMTLRVADREVIKVRPFVRLATNLSLSSGEYATNIPAFNPLQLFADGGESPERFADAAPEVGDADVSLVKRDLSALLIDDGAPGLTDDEVAAQMEEERRLAAEAGKRPALPLPPQLMLSRTLRQPTDLAGALPYASPTETPFSGLEVRVVPENVTVLAKKDAAAAREPAVEERQLALKKGETLEQVLKANGASAEQIKTILAALAVRAKVAALAEGQQIKLLIAPGPRGGDDRQIVRVSLVDDRSIQAMAAINDGGAFVPVQLPQDEVVASNAPTGTDEEDDDGEDGDGGTGVRLFASLYETAAKNDIPRAMVDELVRIFASDVDFQKRVSGGDSIEVFYSEEEDGSRPELLYASLMIGSETHRIFRFQSQDDNAIDYFDEEGRSLKKFLIRKPIAEGIMRSGFGSRRHPILGYSKMHTGVDWSNRIGTPIVAAGDGTVIKAGWESGYGKRIEIQHGNGYVTSYSHQSGFARGIAVGTRVRQGQVIGYLGSTGLSTGPHLHYEVMVNGHFVNPMKIKVPRGRELDGKMLADFRRQRDQVKELIAKAATSTRLAQGL